MVNFFIERKQHTAKYYSEVLSNDIKLDMVLIPEGEFMMGAPETELRSGNRERPQHKVNVPTFFMGRYPVTQEQWQAVAALPQVNRELESEPSDFKGNKRPVERVSWSDAKEFCDRLTQHTNREYRLPTEAEWEYACRAVISPLIKEGQGVSYPPFHYGETITTELANYNGNYVYGAGVKGKYREETTEVGKFPANEFGLCDMHGNVWEWCEDNWHKNYEDAPNDGSAWLTEKSSIKVTRGGSWNNYPINCRSAFRYNYNRGNRNGIIGFRVVCVASRTT